MSERIQVGLPPWAEVADTLGLLVVTGRTRADHVARHGQVATSRLVGADRVAPARGLGVSGSQARAREPDPRLLFHRQH